MVLKSLPFPRTFGIDRLDADVLASVFEECSSHSWSSKIKAGPSIFARRTSVRAFTTLARWCLIALRPTMLLISSHIFSSGGKVGPNATDPADDEVQAGPSVRRTQPLRIDGGNWRPEVLLSVEYLSSAGNDGSRRSVAHVAPLGWDHIGLPGDYVWTEANPAAPFRPLREVRSTFQPLAA